MKHRYTLFSLLLYLFSLPLVAQITFIIPDKTANKGELIDAEIRLKTRDSIVALQFTIEWNPDILEFNSIENLTLPGVTVDDAFGLNNVFDGNFKFLWISTNSDGVRFADSSMIYKVKFKTIGAKGSSSKVKFTSSQIRIRALNPRVDTIAISTRDGMMSIIGSNAVGEVVNTEGGIKLHQNIPNPVESQTIIPFELEQSQEVKLQIRDVQGRLILDKKSFFNSGKQEWFINTEGVLQKGVYIYSIETQRGKVARTLIKL